MSYLAQLLSGYRQGLASDLTQPAEAILAALADESDPTRRGTLLGLLAHSLLQQDCELLKIGDSLTRTRRGHWMTGMTPEQWQKQYADLPIRLRISCRREGYEPWTLLREVHPVQSD